MSQYSRLKKVNKNEEARPSSTTLQTLALFIILLSFFIVLNSLSTFEEEKIRPVMESIEATFANRVIRNERAPSVTDSEELSINEGSTYQNLDALFKSQFAQFSDSMKVDDEKGLFYVTLTYKALQKALDDVEPQTFAYDGDSQSVGSFSELMKSLLSDQNKDLRMDIAVYAPSSFFTASRAEQKLVIQDVSYLGQRLEEIGFPTLKTSIGIEEYPSLNNEEFRQDMPVLLVMRAHSAYAPIAPIKQGGVR